MKKIVSIFMAAAMVLSMAFSLTACGKDDNAANSSNEAKKTVAQELLADFQSRVNGKDDVEIEVLAVRLMENDVFGEISMGGMIVEQGLLNGFTAEVNGFEKGYMFSPMIGSMPFVGYIFKLSDDADVEAFKTSLKEKADLRWNICTEADEMLCENSGSYVLFVMAPTSFDAE